MKDYMAEVIEGKGVVIFEGASLGRIPMSPPGTTVIDYSKLDKKPTVLGDNTIIGANAIVYSDVIIGKNCLIGDGVCIREGVRIGDNCIVGMNTKIGARTTIDDYTRIMDLTNMASDATIGKHVFIGPGVIMGNDNSMGRNDDYPWAGPTILDYATIGMNSTILPSIIIHRDALVAAGSVVTKDVHAGNVVMGVPARFVRKLVGEEKR